MRGYKGMGYEGVMRVWAMSGHEMLGYDGL